MLTALHTLIYSDDPDATRRFLRDVLEWPSVDAHGGWLIFKSGPSELGVHPTADESGPVAGPHHEISIMCDDLTATMAELSARGAQFSGPVQDRRFGRTVTMEVPGTAGITVYEPAHPVAFDL